MGTTMKLRRDGKDKLETMITTITIKDKLVTQIPLTPHNIHKDKGLDSVLVLRILIEGSQFWDECLQYSVHVMLEPEKFVGRVTLEATFAVFMELVLSLAAQAYS